MAELEIREEGYRLRHAHVPINLEAHVRYGPPRQDNAHYVLGYNVQPGRLIHANKTKYNKIKQRSFSISCGDIHGHIPEELVVFTCHFLLMTRARGTDGRDCPYLIGRRSDDGDGEGEHKRHEASEDETPPGQLNLMFQHSAEDEGDHNGDSEQRIKPPSRYVLVRPHQSRVDIVFVLVRCSHPGIYFSARYTELRISDEAPVQNNSRGGGGCVPSVEKPDVGQSGGYGGEPETVRESEEHAQGDAALFLVCRHVYLELVVDNGRYVVSTAVAGEQVGGEDGEVLRAVQVQSPVAQRDDDVQDDEESDEYVDDGEEGADEGAEQEGGDGGPVQGESPNAQTPHAGAELLGGDRLGEHPANPGNARQRGEQVPRDGVPSEAAEKRDEEKLGPRHSALLLLVQGPARHRETPPRVTKAMIQRPPPPRNDLAMLASEW